MFAAQFATTGSRSRGSLLARDRAIAISASDSRIVSRNFVTLCCALFARRAATNSVSYVPGIGWHRERQLTGRDDSRFGSRRPTNAGKRIDIPPGNTRGRRFRGGFHPGSYRVSRGGVSRRVAARPRVFHARSTVNNPPGYFPPPLLTLFTFNRESCPSM